MPTTVTDPFGNTFAACSISTSVKAKFGKDKFASEAEWSKHVKADAWNVLRQKISNGELKTNTILARAPGSMKLKLTKSEGGSWRVQTLQGTKVVDEIGTLAFDMTGSFKNHDWDFGPNMAQLAQAEKLVVNSPAKLADWLDKHDNEIEIGDSIATVTPKGGSKMHATYEGFDGNKPQFKMDNSWGTEIMDIDGLGYYHKSDGYDVAYKVGQTPDVPPAAGLPVSSTSKSVGALTNEDAATMFVKTKDKLATEAGINIKGASGKLDELVYKTIADQAGYTPAEMLAKVEAYKASGKKLSALKKKVLPKSGNPTKEATQKSVDNATAAVKKEEIKPEEVPQVWDSEAVAKAYIKAKDHVVANNTHGWTLYTKNPDFDAEIHKWMQADLGMIKKEVADTSVADYIANHQKLSVLKKQMIKKGELTPQADTLKGGTGAKAPSAVVDSPESLEKWMAKNKPDDSVDLAVFTSTTSGNKYVLRPGKDNDGNVALKWTKVGPNPGPPAFLQKTELKHMQESGLWDIDYKVGTKPKPKGTSVDDMEGLKKALANNEVDLDSIVAVMTDKGMGQKYLVIYKGKNAFDFPQYEFKYPSGTVQKMTQSDFSDVVNGGSYHTEFKVVKYEAPKETGAGQVGKATVDPKKVDPKHELSPEKAHEVFLQWEGLNLPISSSGAKLYGEAKNLAKQYGFGDDVLPILKAVDAGKTAKFGLSPEQNKKMYELKVVEHLKNPNPTGYTSPAAAPTAEAKVFGEAPVDSDLFKAVSPSEMHDLALAGMKKPTSGQSSSLRTYSGSSYHEINGHLRSGKSVDTNTYTKNIQASMSPLPENIVARRGTSLSGLGMHSQEQLTQSIGKTFVEPGFSSTAVGGSGQFGGQVNLVIQAPKGTPAVWLKPHSNIPGENELLLAAGTKFKILKIEQKPGNWGSMTNVVTVRVIP